MPVKQRYSSEFKRVYSTGAIGGFNGYDFTVTFFRENVIHPEDPSEAPIVEREIEAEVVVPLLALKEITRWLLQNLDELEEKNGIICKTLSHVESNESKDAEKSKIKLLAAYS